MVPFMPPPPLALAATTVAATTTADRQAALDAAQKRWKAVKIKSYTYRFSLGCLSCFEPPVQMTVRGGKSTMKPAHNSYGEYKTVPRLFASIQREIRANPYTLDVKYGSKTGVPLEFAEKTTQLGQDDAGGFSVGGFRRLR
jgi:hypothetical protein